MCRLWTWPAAQPKSWCVPALVASTARSVMTVAGHQVESRFIGENAVAYMMWLLRHEGVVPQPGQPVLVTGYGAIGRGVAVACK